MTNQDFTILLKQPQTVNQAEIPHLRELLDLYPYFTAARMLYLRALQQSDSIHFENALNETALYAHDRRWLYYFIYPEKKIEKKHIRSEKNSGDYFGMLNTVEQEGKDINQSLKTLAERLKKARLDVVSEQNTKQTEKTEIKNLSFSHNITENNYAEKLKTLMQEKKYDTALQILHELNLNNPKKSVYFASQIQFLEKIIANKNK